MEFKIIDSSTVEIKFYGYITEWWISADDYLRTLDRIEAGGYKNVNIRTHCYGGSVFEGAAIWSANKKSKLNIKYEIDGIAASMMGVLILSGKVKCEVSQMAKAMIHAPRDNAGGTSVELANTMKLLKSIENDFVNEWTKSTGQSKQDALKLMDGQDHWFDADELIALGIASNKYGEATGSNLGKPDPGTPIDKIFSQYTAVLNDKEIIPHNNTQTMDKQALIDKFNLTGVTKDSSDTAVMEAISAKTTQYTQRISELEKKQGEDITATANTIIAAKETELKTKFTEEEKKNFLAVATASGIQVLTAVLGAVKAVPNLTSITNGEQPLNPLDDKSKETGSVAADRKDWSLATWQEKDPDGLSALSMSEKAEDKKYMEKIYSAAYGGAKPLEVAR